MQILRFIGVNGAHPFDQTARAAHCQFGVESELIDFDDFVVRHKIPPKNPRARRNPKDDATGAKRFRTPKALV